MVNTAKMVVARIKRIAGSKHTSQKKYNMISKIFVDETVMQTPAGMEMENKEAIRKIVPVLKRIYIDTSTRELFPFVVGNPQAQIIMTADFIEFLEKVSEEKKQ